MREKKKNKFIKSQSYILKKQKFLNIIDLINSYFRILKYD